MTFIFFENGFTPFSKFKKTEFKTSFGIFLINKAQGQTLNFVGLGLEDPVFT
jgi:hypothetical protein